MKADIKINMGAHDRRWHYGGVGRRKTDSDPSARRDRRWFYPPRIENRGKSLPFTTRESDFVPSKSTIRRHDDRPLTKRERGGLTK